MVRDRSNPARWAGGGTVRDDGPSEASAKEGSSRRQHGAAGSRELQKAPPRVTHTGEMGRIGPNSDILERRRGVRGIHAAGRKSPTLRMIRIAGSTFKGWVESQLEFGRAEGRKRTLMSASNPRTVIVPVQRLSPVLAEAVEELLLN